MFEHNLFSYVQKNAPIRYLLVQSQQYKHQNDVWNLFKVNNKDFIVTFE